jgi:hypothetical protein
LQRATPPPATPPPATPPPATAPQWLLVQDNHDGNVPVLAPDYLLVAQRAFGPRRSLMLWLAGDRVSQP